MGKFGVTAIAFIGALIIYILAFEGNIGKGLACVVTPGILVVDEDASTTGTS